MTRAERISATSVAGAIDACHRCAAVTRALTDDQYAHEHQGRSPVGAHLRHALEYMQCLISGIDAGVVDYDARERNMALQTERGVARQFIEGLRRGFGAIEADAIHCPLTVRECVAPGHASAESTSTLDRELAFVATHAVHHVEIATLVAALQGIQLPADLGVACSTAVHSERQADGKGSRPAAG